MCKGCFENVSQRTLEERSSNLLLQPTLAPRSQSNHSGAVLNVDMRHAAMNPK